MNTRRLLTTCGLVATIFTAMPALASGDDGTWLEGRPAPTVKVLPSKTELGWAEGRPGYSVQIPPSPSAAAPSDYRLSKEAAEVITANASHGD